MYKCKYKGGDYFEEVGFVAGSHTAYGYGISTDSVSRTGRNADHFTCVLYSFCRSLLCVAIMPLVKAEWWESHQPHAVVFWSVYLSFHLQSFFGAGEATEKVLECIIDDYLTFIVLLFGLFCVAGNITLEGDLAGSPRINVGLLLLGTMLSSWVGTTGASMLMVRPVIKMNAWRKRRSHIMVFFIFLISNMGGCLTPIGDPPLLMGFMRGFLFYGVCIFCRSLSLIQLSFLLYFISWTGELTEKTLQKEESLTSANLVQKYIF